MMAFQGQDDLDLLEGFDFNEQIYVEMGYCIIKPINVVTIAHI